LFTKCQVLRNPPLGQPRPKIVLLHPILGSHRTFAALESALVADGFETIALDLLGFGKSPWHAPSFDAASHIAAIRRTIEGCGPYIALGHSFGALLARQLALQDPSCVGCVSVSTPAWSSMKKFNKNNWKIDKVGWFMSSAPRWATWAMCHAMCQRRRIWRPIIQRHMSKALAIWKGEYTGEILIDAFDHSHHSCHATMHTCLLPLMLGPIEVKELAGKIVFVHSLDDRSIPYAELVAKLGAESLDSDVHLRTVQGLGHCSVVHRPEGVDVIVDACRELSGLPTVRKQAVQRSASYVPGTRYSEAVQESFVGGGFLMRARKAKAKAKAPLKAALPALRRAITSLGQVQRRDSRKKLAMKRPLSEAIADRGSRGVSSATPDTSSDEGEDRTHTTFALNETRHEPCVAGCFEGLFALLSPFMGRHAARTEGQ